MFLTYFAYISLMIGLAGVLYRVGRWFILPIGSEAEKVSYGTRSMTALRALAAAFFHPCRLWIMLQSFLLEILLQLHLYRQSRLRWIMHLFLFYGILLLLMMHTFDDEITRRIFPDYASTVNPYLFLRNLLGILVLVGVLIALIRRRLDPILRRTTHQADRLLLIMLSGIILSGVLLEAVQIVSPALFDQMVQDYMGSDDPEDIASLKAFWAARFDVGFTPAPHINDAAIIAEGRNLHEDYCAACHSRPRSAVLSYPLALSLKPLAVYLDHLRMETWLWYAHYMISCLALALLPFTKLFHLLVIPITLMTRAFGDSASNHAINRPTRRAIGLDACTHCGVCSQHCAVAPVFQVIPNPSILPSEKLGGLARSAAGGNPPAKQIRLSEGSFICTSCGRCTRWCPSGIDLQDLWAASREDLSRNGYPEPHGWIRRHQAVQWSEILKTMPETNAAQDPLRQPTVRLTDAPNTFRACMQCSTCTNVCPVVALSEDPQRDLDMTPQQVMNLMRLQLKETALGCRMVWDCVTCYKCQEHCPQGVRVADVLYELRNEACRRLNPDRPMPADERIVPGAGAKRS